MFEFVVSHLVPSEKNQPYMHLIICDKTIMLYTEEGQVCVLDKTYTVIRSFYTKKKYHHCCYDPKSQSILAISKEHPGTIFQLSGEMEEMAQFSFSRVNQAIHLDQLLYDTTRCRLLFLKEQKLGTWFWNRSLRILSAFDQPQSKLEAVLTLGDRFLCLVNKEDSQRLLLMDGLDGEILQEQVLSKEHHIRSMGLWNDETNGSEIRLFMLSESQEQQNELLVYGLKQDCHQLLHHVSVEQKFSETFDCGCDIQPFMIPTMYCEHAMEHDWGIPECGEDCSQCCVEILQSIALIECSIAHILNAEGERLQKAIACSGQVSQLLQANESVLKTILSCTQLEQMLYCKLECVLHAEGCQPWHCCYGCDLKQER